ncbi:class I SAM-dependent methyltransferase [Dasania sp. GY-MA-18]|uniref:Class I SAM-dependent methyltransferase n=1 Tax=Dasania phycosphaerae TaxID=2950436 RepID=A0A9J6RIC2_9GAMM|nr:MULTISPECIES: class I SAM-dependent methyltransferase [Dasania]MCR8921783.1 class I SAM-dependent methyltransferase [Dasania sp. GY-MA-18]MCZ0864211.1 class I SAM-dependent methyltransferase [Dasania phycosphaerae]MCZ0867939.1 class I SAM-dependent methyltransferase [Dasania phycosphaerae]
MLRSMLSACQYILGAKSSKAPPMELVFPAVEHWFESEEGQALLCAEQYLIKRSLNTCFGYHILQMSVTRQRSLCSTARVQHKFCVYPVAGNKLGQRVDVVSDIQQLPFASGSVDAVVLHHSHEFAAKPQQLLREVERVMVNGGHLIVVGFNPYSLMGLQSALSRYFPRSIWHNKTFSHYRMEDWLSLLGFQVTQRQFGYHRFAGNRKKSRSKFWRFINRCLIVATKKLPLGSFYCITSVKQEAAMTPDHSRWRTASTGFTSLRPKANIRQGKVIPFKKT